MSLIKPVKIQDQKGCIPQHTKKIVNDTSGSLNLFINLTKEVGLTVCALLPGHSSTELKIGRNSHYYMDRYTRACQ
jgi:hypothetical protein